MISLFYAFKSKFKNVKQLSKKKLLNQSEIFTREMFNIVIGLMLTAFRFLNDEKMWDIKTSALIFLL